MALKKLNRHVLVDTDVLDAYKDAIAKAPSRARRSAGLIARGKRAQQLLARLQTYPPKWTGGKRNWTSAKQRRAYFATNGFGKGIPYQRTGDYGRSFGVVLYPGGEVSLITSSEAYPFVGGEDQQQMHIDTGWEYVPDIVDQYRPGFTADMIDAWGRIMEV